MPYRLFTSSKKILIEIEAVYKSIPSNCSAMMGDRTSYEIGDIIVPKIKVFVMKDLEYEFKQMTTLIVQK